MSNKTYELICQHCGQEFTAKSTKAKYHSAACRTAAHRLKEIKVSAASKGDKLDMLMKESIKISHSIRFHLDQIKPKSGNKEAWDKIEELNKRDRVLIREIADLVAN